MKHCIMLLTIFCFVQVTTVAQGFDVKKMDDYLLSLEQKNLFMGTIEVSKGGVSVYSKSIGFADIESGEKATSSSTYSIGSISKTFTSVLIFQAIDKRKIALSTTLDKFFPSIKNSKYITIDMLLSHRSGIHNFTTSDFFVWSELPKNRAEMLKIIEDGDSDFEPNAEARYSNSNYLLLSYILEKVYKKSYEEILRKQIIQPLKLAHTSFGQPLTAKDCKSYKYDGKWVLQTNTHPSVTMGAGSIRSTPKDLNTFFYSLFNGKLISLNSLVQMKALTDGFGRGLFQVPYGKKRGYGHTGLIDGFNSVSVYFPEDSTTYSLNANALNCVLNDVLIAVLDANAFTSQSITLAPEDLDKYLGVYSSTQMPIKLTISKRNDKLVGQGTGQSPFDLVACREHVFRFEAADIEITFSPENGTMILEQNGTSYPMKKE